MEPLLRESFKIAHSILDNTPKGEDFLQLSNSGRGFLHVDSAGASFRYSLEAAQNGKKIESPQSNELIALKGENRTLGAWVGQQFAKRVIAQLDENPVASPIEVYRNVSREILKELDSISDYSSRPIWQREAWSFTHVHIHGDEVTIYRVGDVGAFLILTDDAIEQLPEPTFHAIEGPYQKARTDALIRDLKLPSNSTEFFSMDYAGFSHNGVHYDGLVQNRIDMINRSGMWSGVDGSFQAILGLEDTWVNQAMISNFPKSSIKAIITSSDGLYAKGEKYGLFGMTEFVQYANNPDGLKHLVSRVRSYETNNKGKVYPDDLSAVVYPLEQGPSF